MDFRDYIYSLLIDVCYCPKYYSSPATFSGWVSLKPKRNQLVIGIIKDRISYIWVLEKEMIDFEEGRLKEIPQ